MFIILLLLLLSACCTAPPSPTPTPNPIPIPPGYTKLVFDDEFNGNALDTTKWNYEVNGDGGGNGELQYYTANPANSFVENGILTIQALLQNYQGKPYTSARLNTLSKFSFTYGRVDVMAQLPIGQGLWSAIWALPEPPMIPNPLPTSTIGQAGVYGPWPLSGEIDFMESLGNAPNQVLGTLVYGDPYPAQKYTNNYYTLPIGNFSQDFHLFTFEWSPDLAKWSVDGQLYSTKTPASLGNCAAGPCPWIFNQPFYLLLNVAVGGSFPGSPNSSTFFPQEMNVDYVRVFQ